MKIILFTEGYKNGGVDTFILNLIASWPDAEDEFILVGNASHPAFKGPRAAAFSNLHEKKRLRLRCHRILTLDELSIKITPRGSLVLGYFVGLIKLALRYICFTYYFFALGRLFISENFDRLLVVNGGHPGGDTCRAAVLAWRCYKFNRPKAIYNIHNLATKPKWYIAAIEDFIDAMISRCSSYVVAVSNACLDSLLIRPGFRSFEKWRVIYNGIAHTDHFKNNPKKADFLISFNLPEDSVVLLMLATYEARKGHGLILAALKRLVEKMPNVHLLICGDGTATEIENVKNAVAAANLMRNVRIEKFCSDVHWLIQCADIVVVPSQSYESFGLVIIEAMAMGVPVVATDVGGIPEVLVDGECGYCVSSKDEQKFSDRIMQLIIDPTLYKLFALQGRWRFSSKFTAKRMASEYRQLLLT